MLRTLAIFVKIILCAFIVNVFSVRTICAQKDYSVYYQKIAEAGCNESSDDFIKRYRQVDQEYGLLQEEIIVLSNTYFLSGKIGLAKKYLLRAAACGLDPEPASQLTYSDSLFVMNPGFRKKFLVKCQSFYRDRCDFIKVNAIAKIYAFDQSIRGISSTLNKSDTLLQKKFWRIFNDQDSANFAELCNIIKDPDFDPTRLTTEALNEMYLILMHSATTPSAQADTVFKILWDLVIRGAYKPYRYAAAYDRYYHAKYKMNYYAEFYDRRSPIYDPQNLDKRRAEIWLCPLWKVYQREGMMDRLPEEYKKCIKTN